MAGVIFEDPDLVERREVTRGRFGEVALVEGDLEEHAPAGEEAVGGFFKDAAVEHAVAPPAGTQPVQPGAQPQQPAQQQQQQPIQPQQPATGTTGGGQ